MLVAFDVRERLRTLWRDGLTGSAIARILGITAHAVIGRASRDPECAPRPSPIKPKPPHTAEIIRLPRGGMTTYAATPAVRECQWPTGDTKPYVWCGKAIAKGSYCAKHHRIAYVKGSADVVAQYHTTTPAPAPATFHNNTIPERY
jgi:hypothetical protein